MIAHPDLSSPPSTVVPSVRMMSPSTWLHAFARNDGVHVRAQKQRRYALAGAVKMADQIAAVAVDLFGGAVEAASKARAFQLADEPERDVAFAARERVDLDDFQEQLF